MEVGIYYRVEREGKWVNLDISQLTDEELKKILEEHDTGYVIELIKILDKIILQL